MTEEKRQQLITELRVINNALKEISADIGAFITVDAHTSENTSWGMVFYHKYGEEEGKNFCESQFEEMFKEYAD